MGGTVWVGGNAGGTEGMVIPGGYHWPFGAIHHPGPGGTEDWPWGGRVTSSSRSSVGVPVALDGASHHIVGDVLIAGTGGPLRITSTCLYRP
jgi:hypothetical protein